MSIYIMFCIWIRVYSFSLAETWHLQCSYGQSRLEKKCDMFKETFQTQQTKIVSIYTSILYFVCISLVNNYIVSSLEM